MDFLIFFFISGAIYMPGLGLIVWCVIEILCTYSSIVLVKKRKKEEKKRQDYLMQELAL